MQHRRSAWVRVSLAAAAAAGALAAGGALGPLALPAGAAPAPVPAPAAPSSTTDLAEAADDLAESSAAMLDALTRLHAAQAGLAPARAAAALAAAGAREARARHVGAAQAQRVAETAVLQAAQQVEQGQAEAAARQDRLTTLVRAAYMDGPAPLSRLLSSATPGELDSRLESFRRVLATQRAASASAHLQAAQLAGGAGILAERRDAAAAAADATQAALEAVRVRDAAATEALARVDALVAARAGALRAAEAAQAEDAARYAELTVEAQALVERLGLAEDGTTGAPVAPVPGLLSLPAQGPVTSRFGMRVHPITGVRKMHTGTDLGVACGTPVHAAAAGTVLETVTSRGYGNRVVLRHAPVGGVSLATTYSHLSAFDAQPGDVVVAGQVIARSGSTGYSTGCHLHVEVLAGGSYVDPLAWMR